MAWKQSEKPRTILASRGLVDEFVNMEPAPHDRPLSERRLAVYQRILKAGEFRTVTWASVLCQETNCTYRVNGKHTATMLSGLPSLPEFHVTVERYRCDTLNDVAKLYNTFDSTLASRTASDINLAFAATIRELAGVNPRYINLTVGAASFHTWNEVELRRVSPAERAETLLDHVGFCLWLQGITPKPGENGANPCGSARPILRAPVVAAMLATYQRGPRTAADFWVAVRDETAANRNDPSRVLARYLLRAVMGGGTARATGDGQRLATGREIYAKCIHGWNAWRKGDTTTLSYHAKAPLPVAAK